MEIIFENLMGKMHEKLKMASSVTIAVAYFRPDEETLKILKKAPEVKIIVSKEFDKSDPYKLEEITLSQEKHEAKCIPVFPNRLHAKVIYGENKDGKSFVFIGSANLTSDGLSQNREATIMFDSGIEDDKGILRDISGWLKELYNGVFNIDYVEAKRIFNSAPHHSIGGKPSKVVSNHNWTIKTRDGREPEADNYWNIFRAEGVIALGWGGGLKIDPRGITHEELRTIIEKRYKLIPTKAGRISKEIMQFAGQENGIQINDIIWIIGSFLPNQKQPIDIYGVAKVTGELQCDWESPWWNYKRAAKIFPIEHSIDIQQARKCFAKGAMTETLYPVHNDSFEKLCTEIHKEHGIVINL